MVDPDNVYKNNQSHSCSIANLDDSVCPFMVRKFCYISLWLKFCLVSLYLTVHCLKSVRIRSFSDPYFPAFGLNTERYSAFLLIQSGYEKTRTRKVPNTDTFHTVIVVSVWINFLMSGFHKSYILKLTHSWKLQICLSIYDLSVEPNLKGIRVLPAILQEKKWLEPNLFIWAFNYACAFLFAYIVICVFTIPSRHLHAQC